MTNPVIQFRANQALVDRLRLKNVNPNEFAREAFEQRMRQLDFEENLKKILATPVRLEKSAVEVIREMRDSR